MPEGTPVVRNVPLPAPRPSPQGAPVFEGDRQVVEAWNARAKAELRAARAGSYVVVLLAVVGASAGVLPLPVALAVLGAVGVAMPLVVLEAGARAAQRPFEVFEDGVRATERRRLLRFRRFAGWPQIAFGEAREVGRGRYHLRLTLVDGTVLESVPGEATQDAVRHIHVRTGEQVRGL